MSKQGLTTRNILVSNAFKDVCVCMFVCVYVCVYVCILYVCVCVFTVAVFKEDGDGEGTDLVLCAGGEGGVYGADDAERFHDEGQHLGAALRRQLDPAIQNVWQEGLQHVGAVRQLQLITVPTAEPRPSAHRHPSHTHTHRPHTHLHPDTHTHPPTHLPPPLSLPPRVRPSWPLSGLTPVSELAVTALWQAR